MLTAQLLSRGETVTARHATRKDGYFTCPECGGEVILKKGRVKIPHFAHKPDSACEYGGGESSAHLRCKESIFNGLSRFSDSLIVQMEKQLGKVRPDIYIESSRTGKKYAIEVQISNLTMEKITQRTIAYANLDVHVLWLPLLEETKAFSNQRYSPRSWEKWLHALHFGQVYYWVDGLIIQPIHFDEYRIDVPVSEFYSEYGELESFGGYSKRSKRYRTPIWKAPIELPRDFVGRHRQGWVGGDIYIPKCTILTGKV